MTSPGSDAQGVRSEALPLEPGTLTLDPASRMDRLLRPRSVAVIGASQNPSYASVILRNLLSHGYGGAVVAVNPRYDCILDAPCYPTVLDVPGPVDLAIVGVPRRQLDSVLEQCERKRVGALCLITSGFAEMGGSAAAERQAELSAWAARTGIAVCGPNCWGLMSVPSGLIALPLHFERYLLGSVGAILQSGAMALTFLAPMLARGIGVTDVVTSGNEADLEAADYIRYLVENDRTRIIACFAEQIKTPERFIAACELAAERRKPIVMLKIGRSEAGRRAALAHTGALVGSDDVIDAVLRKLGVARVNRLDELIEAVAVFHARKLPRGGGVAPLVLSGGAGGLLSDLAADARVTFPTLPEGTAQKLRAIIPEYGTISNPLDITSQAVYETEILEGAVDLLAEAGNVDIVVYGRSFPAPLDRAVATGKLWEQAVERHPEVLFLVMSMVGGHFHPSQYASTPPAEPIDRLDGVPFLQGGEYGLKAIAALIRYAEFQRARAQESRTARRLTPETVAERARALVRAARGSALTERESKAILALYGIPTTREKLVTSVEGALVAADEIGYPIALKVESPDLPHKTEAGAILLGLEHAAAVEEGFERVLGNARRATSRSAIRGVLVQEMLGPGTEMILGMSRDQQFGPVLACGLGGTFVEVLRDVQLMLPPVAASEARSAIERLRGFPILQGLRGARPADLEALVDVLLRFSELCHDLRDVVGEIDVNPLVVFEAGRGACAVDCLIVPAAAKDAS